MRRRRVEFAPEAERDARDIYGWIAEKSSPEIAERYVDGVYNHCLGFDLASERGRSVESSGRPGLRVVGYKRTLSIAFIVEDDRVIIARLFRAGLDWQAILRALD